MVIDSLGNVYVAGKKTISSTNTDFAIIKYNSSGSQQWVTTYDGPAAGLDVAQSLDVNENLNVFACGMSADSTATFDIVTMRLNSNGSVNWIYRYNGPANNTDLVTQLKIDVAGEIVLTAGSEDVTTDMDYLTMCYTTGGSLVWSERYDGTANLFDQTSCLYVDALANIYISGAISVSQNHYEYAILKYSQPEKNGMSLDNMLKRLAQSFEDVSKNDTVKNILNDHARRSVDEYYHIFFSELFESGLDSGIDIKAEMNAKLEDLYPQLAAGKDHVAKLIGGLHYANILLNPHIIMPDFRQVDSVDNEMDEPLIAYSHTRDDYPIPCINCEDSVLDREIPNEFVSTVAVVDIPISELLLNRNRPVPIFKTIYNCTASLPDPDAQCEICSSSESSDGIDEGEPYTLFNHEIEIVVGLGGINIGLDGCLITEDVNNADNDLDIDPEEINPGNLGNYAFLSKLPGFIYYDWESLVSPNIGSRIKKLTRPIIDRFFYEENHLGGPARAGDAISLCLPENRFNVWGESTVRYSLGQGGVYEISRPVENQQKLFFAFPYARTLWFVSGQDMRLFYGSIDEQESCQSSKRAFSEEYETQGCEFCNIGEVGMQLPASPADEMTDYLATVDKAFITNYWLDNAITVGFGQDLNHTAVVSTPDFYASYIIGGCTPDPDWELVLSAVLTPDGWYEVEKNFIDNETFEENEVLHVHVRANFVNGESINACRDVALSNPDVDDFEFKYLTTQIRGGIKDYSSSDVNYQVDVYKDGQ